MKPIRFLAYSCTHVPFVDPKAHGWLLDRIREHRPELIVNLGDSIDSAAASKYADGHEAEHVLEDEFRQNNTLLEEVRRSAGRRARCVFLPGNHEDNIMRIGRLPKGVRSLVSWCRPENQPELSNWHIGATYNYCRLRGCFRAGQLVFAHGYEHGASGDENQTLYFANEYGLCVLGHTHRPTPGIMQCRKTAAGVPLRYWYANAGTLRNMDPDYMRRNRKMSWGQACVVGDFLPTKSPRLSRMWSAEVLHFRMFDDFAEESYHA